MTVTKEILVKNGYRIGKDFRESIYILQDGTLVDGDFQEGCGRCEDHRMMESFSLFDRYDGEKFWNDVMFTNGLVMIVPECEEILIHPKYTPTDEQKKIIKEMVSKGFVVNKFN